MNLQFESVSSVHPGSRAVYINASLLREAHCEQAMFYKQIKGYSAIQSNVFATTGTALHKFVSTMHLTKGSVGDAFMAMMQVAPNDVKIKATLNALAMSMPRLDTPTVIKTGAMFVEQPLIIPWRRYVYQGQDITIVLYGTPDWVSVVNNIIKIGDLKTAWDFYTEKALAKYEYAFQFKFYAWLLYEFGHMFLPLEVANLARDLRMVTQVLIAQVCSKPKWTPGPSVPFTLADSEMVLRLVTHVVEHYILPLNTGNFEPEQTGRLVGACKQCDFKHICHTADTDLRQGLLERGFVVKPYGPAPKVAVNEGPF